jgi:hypothetical protein
MKAVDFLINSLEILHEKFPTCNIRYEFLDNSSTHLVEVTPIQFYNDEEYMNEELFLEEEFSSLYPSEDIVFISEDSLNKIENPILELYGEKVGSIIAEFSVDNDCLDFSEYIVEDYKNENENNYALAA